MTPPPAEATARTAAVIAAVSLVRPSPFAEYGAARTFTLSPQQFAGAACALSVIRCTGVSGNDWPAAPRAAPPASERKLRRSTVIAGLSSDSFAREKGASKFTVATGAMKEARAHNQSYPDGWSSKGRSSPTDPRDRDARRVYSRPDLQ